MSRALVTGGAGFIGSAVARALRAAGHEVAVAGTGVATDPLTPARLSNVSAEVIVHCAGGSSVGASLADPAGELAKTVPALEAVLALARRANARVVLLSSAAVYGDAARVPTDESCPIAPVSPYGEHKQRCEQLCVASGVRAAIIRLFSVYGPGLRKQLLWDACRKARAGAPVFGGTGDEERDWLHVDDAAGLVLAAIDHAAVDAPIFNGASGVGVRVREVVGQICRELGAAAPRFSGVARAGDPPRYIGDITRARALGWAPQVALGEGIAGYCAWFQEQA